ncbi:hypothetical protein E4U16_004979 [Claviceps sp. LM84 group G4]|nr:hypothetical protein E4U16_004979 [Claviceps sp. LM84 group G4]
MLEGLLPNILLRHYLDDFVFVLPAAHSTQAPVVHSAWQQLTTHLGLLRNDGKDAEDTRVEVLGIEIDTLRMMATLPAGKLAKAHDLITSALSSRPLALRAAQQLTGFLNF